jgi:squalene synthase HpnC
MGVGHYENFPVASLMLPRRLREPVALIYHFARRADDYADEGDWQPAERLARLDAFRAELDRIERDQPAVDPLFAALGPMIRQHRLPLAPFRDLLDAFAQDVTKTRYADFAEVIDYCRRSANPVGRLLLHLYGRTDAREFAQSDGICSSLQIINFLQDVELDWHKGRVYLPQDEMAAAGVSEAQIARRDAGGGWQPFMMRQIERARRMLAAGAPLGRTLPGRIGIELRMVVLGGERILRKLHRARGDVFRARPVLGALDWPYLLARALLAR